MKNPFYEYNPYSFRKSFVETLGGEKIYLSIPIFNKIHNSFFTIHFSQLSLTLDEKTIQNNR